MSSPSLSTDPVDRFVAWQRGYNGVSEARCREVARVLRDLATFVGRSAEDAEAKDFADWLESLTEGGLHPNTVRKYGAMVRPFFKWATREKLIPAQRLFELADVPNPRGATGESKPKPYTRKEIARMWAELDSEYPLDDHFVKRWREGRSRWPRVWRYAMRLQDEAIIHLCLFAGLRREEVFRLTVDDLHPDNAYIVVQGAAKGEGREYREREVPMPAALRGALVAWLDFRAMMGVTHNRPWLVLHPRANPNSTIPATIGDPLSFRNFKYILNGLGSGWSYHRLRHTYATESLRSGMPIENLKELLGHARIQQTLAYAKIVPQDNERHMRRTEQEFSSAVGRSAA